MANVIVTITSWDKHQRKDIKRPSWFSLDNRLIEDDDFYSFSAEEFKVWIYLLSKASQKQSSVIEVVFSAALRKSNLSEESICSALVKLEQLKIVTVDVPDTSRGRRADVTLQTNKQTTTEHETRTRDEHVPVDENEKQFSVKFEEFVVGHLGNTGLLHYRKDVMKCFFANTDEFVQWAGDLVTDKNGHTKDIKKLRSYVETSFKILIQDRLHSKPQGKHHELHQRR